jgi:hypothetical protein
VPILNAPHTIRPAAASATHSERFLIESLHFAIAPHKGKKWAEKGKTSDCCTHFISGNRETCRRISIKFTQTASNFEFDAVL